MIVCCRWAREYYEIAGTMIYELLTSIHGFSLNFIALNVVSLRLLLSGYFLNCIKECN